MFLFSAKETTLFFGLGLWDIFSCKESIGGIIVADVPEVLSHGNDESSNNKNSKNGGVFAWSDSEEQKRVEKKVSKRDS